MNTDVQWRNKLPLALKLRYAKLFDKKFSVLRWFDKMKF